MSAIGLGSPNSADELYLARGDDVLRQRPIVTGDVFLTDLFRAEDRTRLIVMTHPCTMRMDGVSLRDRLLVAPVGPYQQVGFAQWRDGYFRVMPLPDLDAAGGQFAAFLEDLEPVDSIALDVADRVACLTPRGINFLMQRLVFNMTRVAVGTHRFNEACGPVFDEIEIVEEWRDQAAGAALDPAEAATACHEWLREAEGGVTRQERLGDPQMSPKVRRDSDQALQRWLDSRT